MKKRKGLEANSGDFNLGYKAIKIKKAHILNMRLKYRFGLGL